MKYFLILNFYTCNVYVNINTLIIKKYMNICNIKNRNIIIYIYNSNKYEHNIIIFPL